METGLRDRDDTPNPLYVPIGIARSPRERFSGLLLPVIQRAVVTVGNL